LFSGILIKLFWHTNVVMDGSPVKETVEKIAKEFQEAGATKWDILKIIKGLENEKQPEKKLRKKLESNYKTLCAAVPKNYFR